MANPVRSFISQDHRLFKEEDVKGKTGIALYEGKGIRGMVGRFVDRIRGRLVSVTDCGDTVTVDKKSAEAFFERNAEQFEGILEEGMSVQKKLLLLVKHSKESGLPRGLFEDEARGGTEGKKLVIGNVRQFLHLIDALEKYNGFRVSHLREQIFQSKETGYIQYDREEFFSLILQENKGRAHELNATSGRVELCRLAQILISRL